MREAFAASLIFSTKNISVFGICNSRLGVDYGVGKYTYVGRTGSSVIDYVIVNPLLLKNIRKFAVGEPNILSDHCRLNFLFHIKI